MAHHAQISRYRASLYFKLVLAMLFAYSHSVAAAKQTSVLMPPSSIAVQGVSGATVNLYWVDTNFSETGYSIERSLATQTNFTVVATTASNITNFSDTGLSSGTSYTYRIRL